MILHMVSFKLKEKTPEVLRELKNRLLALQEKIPEIRSMQAGGDLLGSERSFDFGLAVQVDSLAALEVYQKHPEHLKVAEYIAAVRTQAVAVDFEI